METSGGAVPNPEDLRSLADVKAPLIQTRKLDAVCIILIMLVTVLSWIPRRRGPIDLRWDAGTYYILGTSLAEGKGYRLLNEPGEISAIQYPPLLPAIVAVHEKLLRSGDPTVVGPWLRFTWFILSVSSAIGTFFLAKLFLPRQYALVSALICILSYELFFVSTLCFAELPFFVVTVTCVYLHYKPKPGGLAKAAVPLMAIAAYLLRTVGIALLAAWVIDALFRRNWLRAAIRACVALLPVLLWQSYIRSIESSYAYQHPFYSYQRAPWMFYNVSYATNVSLKSPFEPDLGRSSFEDMVARFMGNAALVPYNIGESLTSPTKFWISYLSKINRFLAPATFPVWLITSLFYLLAVATLAGLLLQFLQRRWLLGSFLALTLAAVCMTPWPGQNLRYLAPVTPFLLLALFEFVFFFLKSSVAASPRWRQYLAKGTAVSITSLVLLGSLASCRVAISNFLDRVNYQDRYGVTREYRLMHFPSVFSSMTVAMKWLKAHANPESVVAVSMPHWAYLETGLKTVMPPLENDPAKAQRMLDSVPVTYIILESMFMEHDFNQHFPSLVQQAPEKWSLVHKEQEVSIYRRSEKVAEHAEERSEKGS